MWCGYGPPRVDGAELGRPLRPIERLSQCEGPGGESLQGSRTQIDQAGAELTDMITEARDAVG